MTKVRFEIKSRNENATIYARFQNGRKNSFVKKTFLFVKNPDYWVKEEEIIKCIAARRQSFGESDEKCKYMCVFIWWL